MLLAVDDSAHSARAVAKAAELCESSGADVLVLHVRELLPVGAGAHDIDVTEETKDVAQDVANELKSKGAKASAAQDRQPGLHPRLIVEAANQFDADVIVMGSRGRSDLPSLLLGSVTHKVLHMTDVPVLVVR
jgi:nucleotide-binding universal stress UspA family protein